MTNKELKAQLATGSISTIQIARIIIKDSTSESQILDLQNNPDTRNTIRDMFKRQLHLLDSQKLYATVSIPIHSDFYILDKALRIIGSDNNNQPILYFKQ